MGCLRNVFAMIGCFTVLIILALVAWFFRDDISERYREWRESDAAEEILGGRASLDTLEAAREKLHSMEDVNGPWAVQLTAAELASLIVDGLTPDARTALDSIRVSLEHDRLTLRASLRTGLLKGYLGPLGSAVVEYEPVLISGTGGVERPGVALFEPDRVSVAAIPLPGPLIAPVVDRITGLQGGAFQVAIPRPVGDLRIRPEGVTFYRRAE